MIHTLRQHSKAIARGMISMLLLSWLSLFYVPCLAAATVESAPALPVMGHGVHGTHGSHAGMQPAVEMPAPHDCCDKSAATSSADTFCDGLSCADVQPSAVAKSNGMAPEDLKPFLVVMPEFPGPAVSPARRFLQPLPNAPPGDTVPAYLRFGVFLN